MQARGKQASRQAGGTLQACGLKTSCISSGCLSAMLDCVRHDVCHARTGTLHASRSRQTGKQAGGKHWQASGRRPRTRGSPPMPSAASSAMEPVGMKGTSRLTASPPEIEERGSRGGGEGRELRVKSRLEIPIGMTGNLVTHRAAACIRGNRHVKGGDSA